MEFDEEECRNAENCFIGTEIKKWLRECTENIGVHVLCRKTPNNASENWPKRLIDVGHRSTWPCFPRLVLTAELQVEDLRYVALSHVWGLLNQQEKRDISTTIESQAARMEGTPLNRFPDQYKAVMILCRCLDVPYLWIDSLCIIQVGAPIIFPLH